MSIFNFRFEDEKTPLDEDHLNKILNAIKQINSLLSIKVDLSYVNTRLNEKQDKLVSGSSIRSLGGYSLLGSGNISFPE